MVYPVMSYFRCVAAMLLTQGRDLKFAQGVACQAGWPVMFFPLSSVVQSAIWVLPESLLIRLSAVFGIRGLMHGTAP